MASTKQTTDMGTGNKGKTEGGKTTAESGADEQDSSMHASTDAVPVSEEFQKATHKLLSKANKHHVMHVRNAVNTQEDKLRREEKPDELSAKDMPESPY